MSRYPTTDGAAGVPNDCRVLRCLRSTRRTTFRGGTRFAIHDPVTVRIIVAQEATFRLVRVEGRLIRDAWEELEQAIGDAPNAASLDLSGLRSADAFSLEGLRRLRAEGVELRGVPPHLAWRIEDVGG